MAGLGGADRAGSSALASTLNAAPFVPKSGGDAGDAAALSPAPGAGRGAAAAPANNKLAPSKLTLSAAPFVPGAGGAQQASAAAPRPASAAVMASPAKGAPANAAHKMSAAANSFVPTAAAVEAGKGTPSKVLRSPGKGRGGAASGAAASALATAPPGANRGGRGRGRPVPGQAGVGGGPASLPPGPPPGLDPLGGRLGNGNFAGIASGPGTRRTSPLPYGGYGHGPGSHGHAHLPGQLPYQAGRGRVALVAQFMHAGLRQQLQQCHYLEQAQWTPGPGEQPLPERLHVHHSLYPLEEPASAAGGGAGDTPSQALGVRSTCLKGVSTHDGRAYVLRHIDGKQVIPTSEMLAVARQAVDSWDQLAAHPGLSIPRAAFVSSELDGSAALFFAHDFYPGACTLAQAHLVPTQTASGQLVTNAPSEDTLWSYLVQLASAVRVVHAAALSVRAPCLHPSKVLLLPTGRLRVGSLGVVDALSGAPGSQEELAQAQLEDLAALGQLILALASSIAGPAAAMMPSLDFVAGQYSPDLVRVLALLLAAGEQSRAGSGGGFSWRHLWAVMGEHCMVELDSLGALNQQLIQDLSRESENGRLARLLVKLGFVVDRPDADGMSQQWSDTGDRYLVKLFRGHLFHQWTDTGQPRLDWGHIVEALNKLDAGLEEQLLLLSRDETSMLVVSYADVKRCVENAYGELKAQAGPTAASRAGR